MGFCIHVGRKGCESVFVSRRGLDFVYMWGDRDSSLYIGGWESVYM